MARSNFKENASANQNVKIIDITNHKQFLYGKEGRRVEPKTKFKIKPMIIIFQVECELESNKTVA